VKTQVFLLHLCILLTYTTAASFGSIEMFFSSVLLGGVSNDIATALIHETAR
jgi:hypothetical protein